MNTPQPKPHILNIKPYKQGKTSNAPDVTPIKLSSNENSHGASPKAIEAYVNAHDALHRYPEGSCAALRQTLAEKHKLDANNILCGSGSDELINLLISTYASKGDEVLFTEHAFLMYNIYTIANNATPVEATEVNLCANVDNLLAAVTKHTKIVFLANPNNPTGSYLRRDEIKRLRDKLPSHIILAIDGAYAECATADDYDDGLSLATSTPNTVMLRTFSKLYGLPALRIGWMTAHTNIINAVARIKSPFNITHPAQEAAIAAVKDDTYLKEQIQHNHEQRAWMADACQALGYVVHPSQGNFILVDFGSAETSQRIISGLEAQHIYIRDVTSYKLPTCGRITIGTVKENQQFIQALKELST